MYSEPLSKNNSPINLVTDSDYKDFWSQITSLVLHMRTLDPENNLVYGAGIHQYSISPVVADSKILEFERKNKIEIPRSYRTYLQYFGGSGASQFNGTLNFLDKIFPIDVSSPSPMPLFQGTHDCGTEEGDFETHLLECEDGRVEIARGFNPSIPFLVLNGKASGQVYWWNFGDMCGSLGDFAHWHHNWANRVIDRLTLHHKVHVFPIGSSVQELMEAFPGLVNVWMDSSGEQRTKVRNTALYFTLDSNDILTSCSVSGFIND
jgi:hypothetical protein